MPHFEVDPWGHWYDAYVAQRRALKAALRVTRERHRTANVITGLLLGYMLLGGVLASVAVRLVMTN